MLVTKGLENKTTLKQAQQAEIQAIESPDIIRRLSPNACNKFSGADLAGVSHKHGVAFCTTDSRALERERERCGGFFFLLLKAKSVEGSGLGKNERSMILILLR